MDGSIRAEQALHEEVRILRARVAELERAAAHHRQSPIAYPRATEYGQAKEHPADGAYQEWEHRLTTVALSQGQDFSPDAILDIMTAALVVYDQQGHILRTNAAFHQMIGATHQSAYLAQPIDQRILHIRLRDEKGHPLSVTETPITRLLAGEVLSGANEARVIFSTLDGRDIQVSISGAPLYDQHNQIVGAVAIYQDITERRKLEQRTQDVLRTLLAMAEILVQGTDQADSTEIPVKSTVQSSIHHVLQRLLKLARRILGCQQLSTVLIDEETERLQPVAIVGLPKTEVQQWKEQLDSLPLSSYIHDPEQLTTILAGGSITITLPNLTQPAMPHHAILMPMHVGSRLVGVVTIDYGETAHLCTREEIALAEAVSRLTVLVLERERLLLERAEAHANELALLEANRRMDDFLSIASHELRTPLTTINGNIQLAQRRMRTLLSTLGPNETIELVQELLTRAERQVRIQDRLVSDLLDVSRIQANRLELSMMPCNLLDIIYETFEDQHSAVPTRTMHLNVPQGMVKIPTLADADRISQVITNYLTNALKYSDAEQPVDVYVEVANNMVRLSVKDQGPGLPPEEHERIWQRFYRTPGIVIQSGSGVGLGLGLHICRTIIELHQGRVGVESTPGQGSTFWFTLPIHR